MTEKPTGVMEDLTKVKALVDDNIGQEIWLETMEKISDMLARAINKLNHIQCDIRARAEEL